MASSNDHASRIELADHVTRHKFGRQRHECFAVLERGNEVKRGLVQRAKFAGVVNALFAGIQERPLQMNAENAGNSSRDCLVNRRNGARNSIEIIANQGWKQTCCPECAMRFRDFSYALHARPIVKQHTATTVNLKVDKARHQVTGQFCSHDVNGAVCC